MREDRPPGRRSVKRPSGPVRGLAIATVLEPVNAGVASTSICAVEIGTPPGPVSRPVTVSARP